MADNPALFTDHSVIRMRQRFARIAGRLRPQQLRETMLELLVAGVAKNPPVEMRDAEGVSHTYVFNRDAGIVFAMTKPGPQWVVHTVLWPRTCMSSGKISAAMLAKFKEND